METPAGASRSHPTPPPSSDGDPPPTPPPPPHSSPAGDQPAARVYPRDGAVEECADSQDGDMEEALDLNYCSDSDAVISPADKTLKTAGTRATVSGWAAATRRKQAGSFVLSLSNPLDIGSPTRTPLPESGPSSLASMRRQRLVRMGGVCSGASRAMPGLWYGIGLELEQQEAFMTTPVSG